VNRFETTVCNAEFQFGCAANAYAESEFGVTQSAQTPEKWVSPGFSLFFYAECIPTERLAARLPISQMPFSDVPCDP